MNTSIFIPISIIFLVIFFLIDNAFKGIIHIFDYISLSVLYLLILKNYNTRLITLCVYFVFGVLIDWYYKKFLGFSSLLILVLYYSAALIENMISQNNTIKFFTNFLISYILLIFYNGYGMFFNEKILVGSLIISMIVWGIASVLKK